MIEKRSILVDTNVINNVHASRKDLAQKTKDFLALLANQDNKLYVSDYVKHELFRSASAKKSNQLAQTLENFINVPTSSERIERATKLHTAYSSNKSVKPFMQSISTIDLFIGALLFTDKNPLILTADYNDFPRPFFKEVHMEKIEYKTKKKETNIICYYLLQANLDMLQ